MLTKQILQIKIGLLRKVKNITSHLEIQLRNNQYHPYPPLKSKRQIFATPNRSYRRIYEDPQSDINRKNFHIIENSFIKPPFLIFIVGVDDFSE
jgi:hypothetical protein